MANPSPFKPGKTGAQSPFKQGAMSPATSDGVTPPVESFSKQIQHFDAESLFLPDLPLKKAAHSAYPEEEK